MLSSSMGSTIIRFEFYILPAISSSARRVWNYGIRITNININNTTDLVQEFSRTNNNDSSSFFFFSVGLFDCFFVLTWTLLARFTTTLFYDAGGVLLLIFSSPLFWVTLFRWPHLTFLASLFFDFYSGLSLFFLLILWLFRLCGRW